MPSLTCRGWEMAGPFGLLFSTRSGADALVIHRVALKLCVFVSLDRNPITGKGSYRSMPEKMNRERETCAA